MAKTLIVLGRKEKEQYKVAVVEKLWIIFLYEHEIQQNIMTQNLRSKKKNLWNCRGDLQI